MAKSKWEVIKISNRTIRPHKCKVGADFKAKALHVSNGLEYVEILLKAKNKNAALFCAQAKGFYNATQKVDVNSKPLTAYYCVLNLAKALLAYNGIEFVSRTTHGVGGKRIGEKTSLSNEIVKFHTNGVLSELRKFYGEDTSGKEYSLSNILYNLPYIHRAYCVSFAAKENTELFIPLEDSSFVKLRDGNAYFCAKLSRNWSTSHIVNKLPSGFERYPTDLSVDAPISIRWKKRFKWSGRSEKEKLKTLDAYHAELRKKIFYIYDAPGTWYLKRDIIGAIPHSPVVLTFAALHRLSELARYEPLILDRHLNTKYNWLIAEFLNRCLDQVIDEVIADTTKKELRRSGD